MPKQAHLSETDDDDVPHNPNVPAGPLPPSNHLGEAADELGVLITEAEEVFLRLGSPGAVEMTYGPKKVLSIPTLYQRLLAARDCRVEETVKASLALREFSVADHDLMQGGTMFLCATCNDDPGLPVYAGKKTYCMKCAGKRIVELEAENALLVCLAEAVRTNHREAEALAARGVRAVRQVLREHALVWDRRITSALDALDAGKRIEGES